MLEILIGLMVSSSITTKDMCVTVAMAGYRCIQPQVVTSGTKDTIDTLHDSHYMERLWGHTVGAQYILSPLVTEKSFDIPCRIPPAL